MLACSNIQPRSSVLPVAKELKEEKTSYTQIDIPRYSILDIYISIRHINIHVLKVHIRIKDFTHLGIHHK